MILSDREISAALSRGAITIDPPPDPVDLASTAIDLRLDGPIQRWDAVGGKGASIEFDPTQPDFNVTELIKQFSNADSCEKGFLLHPGMFVLGWTVERVHLPHRSRIAARVEGKSSLARLGVGVHITAPTIHAGFGYSTDPKKPSGAPIQLEIWNAGPLKVKLTKLMPICQLILEEVHGTPDKGYQGRFNAQGPDVKK